MQWHTIPFEVRGNGPLKMKTLASRTAPENSTLTKLHAVFRGETIAVEFAVSTATDPFAAFQNSLPA